MKTAKIRRIQHVARGVVTVELQASIVGNPTAPQKLIEELTKLLLASGYIVETEE